MLDLGSGSGTDAFRAGLQVGASGRVVGLDFRDEQIAKATRLGDRGGFAQVEFVEASIDALPFEDGGFDVVISNGVINLSPIKQRVFAEAARVLRPGGRLAEAGQAAVDFLVGDPMIDPDRIGLAGFSFDAVWSAQIAAIEPRLRCVAAIEGVDPIVIFNRAQPNYRRNFMYMSGIDDDVEFDAMAEGMKLDDVVPLIECPSLFVQGEFDELRPVDEALRIFERAARPKELWILEDQFHPMGEWADELPALVVDWVGAVLAGDRQLDERRLFLRRDGTFVEGSSEPPWWSPERLLADQ